jgi:alpha-D-xyloside xylohydrolase
MKKLAIALSILCTALNLSPACAAAPEKVSDGIIIPVGDRFLRIQVCADDIIRVAESKDRAFFTRKSLPVDPARLFKADWKLKTTENDATLTTAKLNVRVDLKTGAVSFLDASGQPVLAEKAGGRTLTPAIVQGDQTFHVRQEWEPNEGEALYGLGQHQTGLLDIKGYDMDLWQHNGTVIIPFLMSSRGYGVFWDNTSYSRFGDLRPWVPIPPAKLFDAEGKPGGLTGNYFAGENFDRPVATRVDARIDIQIPSDTHQANKRIHPDLSGSGPVSIRWTGEVQADETGDYLLQPFSNNGIQIWVDDQLVISHWRQGWLPWINVARVHFEAGSRHRLRVEWTKEQGMETMQLFWKTPSHNKTMSLWSEVGDGVDYFFVYGPDLGQVIAGYREITGRAPMMPRWAFGLWQCRQRYKTQQESLDVLGGFRSRGIPIDNIVQDWFYWKEDQWGSHQFDPVRFPDPAGWIRSIHDTYHARVMISVWPKFYPTTENFKAMRARGFLYEPNLGEDIIDWVGHPDTFYDAFNPAARKLFWDQINLELFSKNVDAWWMDASEPDMLATPTLEGQRAHIHPNALGSGARMLNAYPLENAKGIYEGQRQAAPDQRVFILTRSGFAGQQRYAGAVWSGDISSTWTALRAQITAGLGFGLSGMPYWTMDSGGFSVPARFSGANPAAADVEEWRELNARWFEFSAFAPFLRVHGEFPNREMWEFGGETSPTYQAQLKFDRLRYRLMPYIYSLAGAVTHQGGTLMRALVFDFRTDPKALDVRDQFMFGPALLVNPVTSFKARTRPVYLPQAAGWYDFWTGASFPGGQTVDAPAPYDSLPIYVKAGSIVPTGPELQYTAEKPADPVTLYVYAGADGAFMLYEDDGLTFGYEKGAFAEIPIRWNDATKTLTLDKRQGSFPGMLKERTFNVIVVDVKKPVGFSFTAQPDKAVHYTGAAVQLQWK